jgi:acyl-coenzyme A thioesterase PaaI-like protein
MTSKTEIVEFLAREFPQNRCIVKAVGNASATVKHPVGVDELRPGATVSGPLLMKVADVALFVALLGEIGIVPLAVTSSLTINFLRKAPPGRSIIGVCKVLKLGRSLAVGEVALYSEGSQKLVAHAVGTYSIPRTHYPRGRSRRPRQALRVIADSPPVEKAGR